MGRVIVWISGGSSGIGAALVEHVPWPDARIIDISRSGHPAVEHLAADLSEPEGWETVRRSFDDELGGDAEDIGRAVFVHAAATLDPIGFAGEVDPSGYERQVMLNAASPLVLGDAFIRSVTEAEVPGDLVQITSGAATSVYEGWSGYGPAKAAVDHWVRTVGAERDRRGTPCRILSVAPGVVATEMQATIRRTPEEDFPNVARFLELHDSGELRDPGETARQLWRLIGGEHDNGAVIDIRDLDEASSD